MKSEPGREYATIEAMLCYGGGFVRKLAEAYRAADAQNRGKLREAFPEYWKQYQDLAAQRALAQAVVGDR